MKVLLSRTDNIGDVIFTLPMAGLIKQYYPHWKIYFLGKEYTRAIVECSTFIDAFYNEDEIIEKNFDIIIHVFPNKKIANFAKKVGINLRVGTNRRLFHFFNCNKLVNLTRKNSELHEAQLNFKLLSPLNIFTNIPLEQIPNFYGFTKVTECKSEFLNLIDTNKFNLILHPKSKGSAREWSAENYIELCKILPKEQFKIFISGTQEEKKEIEDKILKHVPEATSLVGKMSLNEFISFIQKCDGLVACSTGPLHIASALGIHALGLYPPLKNMLPSRWGPLGHKADCVVGTSSKNQPPSQSNLCTVKKCNKSSVCICLNGISPLAIKEKIMKWKKQ
jgi:heptosyltransferase-3